ncbi:putative signal transduction protein [Atlantibacter hermannii]|nr:putative signal transduction protein [Atlantibacter hermannii]
MTSKRMISLVTGTMSVAVLLPVVLSIWLARYQAEQRFHQDLSAYSQRINTLASQVIDEAKAALKEINRVDSQTCDRDHLQAMRRVAFTYRYIQEVVFLKGSQALCSSLEQESHIAPFPEPEKISNAGYRDMVYADERPGDRALHDRHEPFRSYGGGRSAFVY